MANRIAFRTLLLGAAALVLLGCSPGEPKVEGRWYTQSQVDSGKTLFLANCAQCHGAAAQGTPNWNKPGADGKYPPPPLNGQAHAWHHPLRGLKATVQNGGLAIGGSMPPFGEVLDDAGQDAVIAYFQSRWPDPIYQAWLKRGGLN